MERRHTDAWRQAHKVHDTQLSAVVASSSLGSNDIVPDSYPLTGEARASFILMGSQTQGPRIVGQSPSIVALSEGRSVRPRDWSSFVASGSGVSVVQLNEASLSYSCRDLSEGRRRVGEILVRCGVINVLGILPVESATVRCRDVPDPRPLDTPIVFRMVSGLSSDEKDGRLIAALADWTSEWVHTLIIQPYIHGHFRFQYQGTPSKGSDSVALRIRRVLNDVYNPLQVAIHVLWFINILTKSDKHTNAPFLSVPIFRYLHNNGTFFAEDFMFRIFVVCAMVGDKSLNDAVLSTNTWNRLSRIPRAVLVATEKYTLNCLGWNVVMTRDQWEETIIYLRSSIKMGSVFDPFGYEADSPSAVMASCLDELLDLAYMDETPTSWQRVPAMEVLAPQPVRHSTHWRVSDIEKWCPEDDPVINRKPRVVGIAPGPNTGDTPKAGTTAKDLLDSILGSSHVSDLAHLARPVGTSFCGSFGAIGARLAQTVKLASTCQAASWFPPHG